MYFACYLIPSDLIPQIALDELCMYVRCVGINLAVKIHNNLNGIEISTSFNKCVKMNKMKSAGSFEMLVTTYKIIEVIVKNIKVWRI
jgi:hypothetical protein